MIFEEWFQSKQGDPYASMWDFAKEAFAAGAASKDAEIAELKRALKIQASGNYDYQEELKDERDQLQAKLDSMNQNIAIAATCNHIARMEQAEKECNRLRAEIAELVAALEKLSTWAKAYPLSVFPEPDFNKASEVLKANGMTLDAISASNMRHVIVQAQGIVDTALAKVRKP